jgi:hypothetical protein
MAIGVFAPDSAMYGYLINFAAPLVRRRSDRKRLRE